MRLPILLIIAATIGCAAPVARRRGVTTVERVVVVPIQGKRRVCVVDIATMHCWEK